MSNTSAMVPNQACKCENLNSTRPKYRR